MEGRRKEDCHSKRDLYVLYLTPIGICTPYKNCVMNYVDDTNCNRINFLYTIWLSAYFSCVGCSCIFHKIILVLSLIFF